MEEEFTDLINTEMVNYNITQIDPKQLEYERALEVINQLIISLLDQCLLEFPRINDIAISKCMEEITKFLSFHEIYEDKEFIDYIGKGLQNSIQEYP